MRQENSGRVTSSQDVKSIHLMRNKNNLRWDVDCLIESCSNHTKSKPGNKTQKTKLDDQRPRDLKEKELKGIGKQVLDEWV